jgi:hypothetical protein
VPLHNKLPAVKADANDPEKLRRLALSRWENEGGAESPGRSECQEFGAVSPEAPAVTSPELTWLRIRVIALENLVVGLLSQATDRQLAPSSARCPPISAPVRASRSNPPGPSLRAVDLRASARWRAPIRRDPR